MEIESDHPTATSNPQIDVNSSSSAEEDILPSSHRSQHHRRRKRLTYSNKKNFSPNRGNKGIRKNVLDLEESEDDDESLLIWKQRSKSQKLVYDDEDDDTENPNDGKHYSTKGTLL